MTRCLRIIYIALVMASTMMLVACGGSGGGGEGVDSSSASIALVVDKTSVAAGTESVIATVTLTSLLNQPVNGVAVSVDLKYSNAIVSTVSGYTNSNGIAVLTVPVAIVATDRTYYLQARSSGVTPSGSVPLEVKAPVLSTTIPTTTSASAVEGSTTTFVLQGDTVTFKDGLGSPIGNTEIIFTLNSQTGSSSGVLLHNGLALNTTTSSTFSVFTDSTGMANTGLTASLTAGAADTSSVVTFYYTLSATSAGQPFTKQYSSQFTLTATAAPAATP